MLLLCLNSYSRCNSYKGTESIEISAFLVYL
nr:MAG TPA: hypothetical protein [Caudoviricetes sp.]